MAANTPNASRGLLAEKYSGKQIFIVVVIIVTLLLLDTSINRTSDLTLKSTSSWSLGIFSIIFGISFSGQNLILRFVKQQIYKSQAAQKSLRLNLLYRTAIIVHYSLAAVIVFAILQMLITSRYDVVLLVTAITISYIFATSMMILLSHRFFSWFRFNKSYTIFLYGLSSIMLVANTSIALWLVDIILLDKPRDVLSTKVIINPPSTINNPVNSTLNYAYAITTVTSFIVTWCATIGLLKNYTHKMTKFTFWLLLTIPLAYFVSQFLIFSFDLIHPLFVMSPTFYGILFTILFASSKPIGGIIFGIGFWMIARNVQKGNVVRSYLVISAYGFLLLFVSNNALVLTFTQYPPFGLVTISFVGLSSYFVLVGIFSSATSISQDAKLRREIRRLAIRESKMLDSIGFAQMEEEIRKRVLHMTRVSESDMKEENIPSTLDEEEVNRYVDDVLREIRTIQREGSFKKGNS
jgi:hypothetical protein